MRTITGHEVDPLNLRPEQVSLEDIAHGLSLICRYGGHVPYFYSVAEHSLLVGALIKEWGGSPLESLLGLLHDAHEAYLGDCISPLKPGAMHCWWDRENEPPEFSVPTFRSTIERMAQLAIQKGLGIPFIAIDEGTGIVARADYTCLIAESFHFDRGFFSEEARDLPGVDFVLRDLSKRRVSPRRIRNYFYDVVECQLAKVAGDGVEVTKGQVCGACEPGSRTELDGALTP